MSAVSKSSVESSDRRYIATMMRAPLLERDYEVELGRRWRDSADETALQELVASHVRLVVRIAVGFKGYGLPLADLIQEGNIGLLEAAKRFDPERNVRFSTYASWWILAGIQEYIVRNASVVRLGTTPSQKSLFFKLRRMRAQLGDVRGGPMSEEHRETIARQLNVPIAAVERMEAHLAAPDRSLNAGIVGDDSDEFMDFLADDRPNPEEVVTDLRDGETRKTWLNEALETLSPREREIIRQRFLENDKTTLAEIGDLMGVTKERIRQIEGRALNKLRAALDERHGNEARALVN